ncbi:hypothetical protein [Aliamphritea hakodatensis]|uniref:hypothetical protein n=1 Tax=Aliamphritea hakodatensis TaxID=2895352 RepID=UPI0022FD7D65|nr:hypothetical protein [Aliamphritea hakodatensis]
MDYLIAGIIALLVFLLLRYLLLRPGSGKPVRYTAKKTLGGNRADRRSDSGAESGGDVEVSRTDDGDSGSSSGGDGGSSSSD